MSHLRYLAIGFLFGVVLMKSEAVSWFRIQEMFRFQSFHMFGILGAAVATAGVLLQVLQRLGVRSAGGQVIALEPKQMGSGARYALGGTCFGLGWALTGACPGPLFTLLGAGIGVMAIAILAALAGTWTYAMLRERLPH
jgi:uncharacterized membrane protein YedE/YeeE